MVHFELIFVYGRKQQAMSPVCYLDKIPFRYTIVPVQFAGKILLFPRNSLCIFVKNQLNILVWVYFRIFKMCLER